MEDSEIREWKTIATKIRLGALEGIYHAKSGHPGGSLSIAEILTYLYFKEMNIDPASPNWEDRDRFVLSKGHCAPALYAALALRGYFPTEELAGLRNVDSYLQGHPDMKGTPGIDMSTGSLGMGISAACGMALAAKMNGKSYRTYTIIGDGESEEGQVWEALMFAAHHSLNNLCVFIDFNGLQIDGPISSIVSPAPYEEKLRGFGANVLAINAHDFWEIANALAEARACIDKPTVIICHSVKGRGVSYMENQVGWHGKAPNEEQYKTAVAELTAQLGERNG